MTTEVTRLADCTSIEEIAEYLTGRVSDHHLCIDCGFNTHPGGSTKQEIAKAMWEAKQAGKKWSDNLRFGENTEVYIVRERVWQEAGMEPYGGCLCIGCLEKRIGRRLRPKDFQRNHVFNQLPATERLLRRQGRWK